jgi:hypothetical protein
MNYCILETRCALHATSRETNLFGFAPLEPIRYCISGKYVNNRFITPVGGLFFSRVSPVAILSSEQILYCCDIPKESSMNSTLTVSSPGPKNYSCGADTICFGSGSHLQKVPFGRSSGSRLQQQLIPVNLTSFLIALGHCILKTCGELATLSDRLKI